MYYNENTIIYCNGSFLKATEAKADLYGQTLHYGYGVFEGIRSYQTEKGTKIFKAKEHYERLKHSCELVNIPFNYSLQELEELTYELLKRNNLTNAYIRPLIYGDPNMGLSKPTKVNVMLCAWEWASLLGDKMLRVCLSTYQRPNPKSVKVEAKVCGHYINSILASTEAKDKGFDEALLLDMHEKIAEAPGANFFCEKDGKLFTPPAGNILPGITRATVLELCEELDIPFEVRHLKPAELKEMDAAFFCGTAVEVNGLASVDDVLFKKEWSTTASALIKQAYANRVRENTIDEGRIKNAELRMQNYD